MEVIEMAKKVRDAMTAEPRTAEPTLSLVEGVRRLPVVENDRLVGVLAQADVAVEAKAKQAGELVEQISKPAGTESR